MAYTTQQTFDMVVEHLVTQGRPAKQLDNEGADRDSALPYVRCMYRTLDGLKCAIGALIPDELYSEGIENVSFLGFDKPEEELVNEPDRKAISLYFREHHPGLFVVAEGEDSLGSSLQRTHDNCPLDAYSNFGKAALKYSLNRLAKAFELNTDKVEKLLPGVA